MSGPTDSDPEKKDAPKVAPPKNGWNSTTGDVYKDGKVVGNAKTVEAARKLVGR